MLQKFTAFDLDEFVAGKSKSWIFWNCDPSEFPWSYAKDEYAYVIAGQFYVTYDGGIPCSISLKLSPAIVLQCRCKHACSHTQIAALECVDTLIICSQLESSLSGWLLQHNKSSYNKIGEAADTFSFFMQEASLWRSMQETLSTSRLARPTLRSPSRSGSSSRWCREDVQNLSLL